MKSKVLNDQGEKTYLLVYDAGDEVMTSLEEFARQNDLTAASFTAIGAFRDVTLAYFNVERNEYDKQQFQEQLEVLSLVGNIGQHQGKPKIHIHVVLGRHNFQAIGGHLVKAHVRPTLEVVLTESPRHMQRRTDEATGLALISTE